MKIVGITGSIGCGKTTIADLFRSYGYAVYDVDGWVRRLYYKNDFIKVILNNFPDVADNNYKVDKKKLRNIVFNDNAQLKKLEALIHPFLKKTLKQLIRRNHFCNDLFLIDAALLFEMGWNKYCDYIIVADVDYEIQKQRVMSRDNITFEDFEKINSVQMKNSDKIILSDFVVNTNKPKNILLVELLSIVDGII